MSVPSQRPLGLQISRTAKELARAFDDAMVAAGGSTSTWLVLLSLKAGTKRTQGELAGAVGVRGPTMTHHLNGLARSGLVSRERAPANQRVQQVRLTDQGQAMFHRLRAAAVAFDRRLKAGLTAAQEAELRRSLEILRTNVVNGQ